MSARERVLAGIRASLHRRAPLADSVRRGLDARLERPPVNVQPRVDGDAVTRFIEKMRAVNGKVSEVPDLGAVAAVVSAHLEAFGLPPRLVVAPDPFLDPVPWSNALAVERRAARGDDLASVTGAFAGIAETGTLMLLSSPHSPTTLNFLPDDHLVVLERARVVKHLEDAWRWLREARDGLPRTVNLITGPSKTADVEQTLQEGAHGPRRLHVVLVGV